MSLARAAFGHPPSPALVRATTLKSMRANRILPQQPLKRFCPHWRLSRETEGFLKCDVNNYAIETTAHQRRPGQNAHAKGRPWAARRRQMFRDHEGDLRPPACHTQLQQYIRACWSHVGSTIHQNRYPNKMH